MIKHTAKCNHGVLLSVSCGMCYAFGIQIQNWTKKSVTITQGGRTVLIPLTKKKFNELRDTFEGFITEEG